jgi:hypothetical protein
MVGVSLPYPSIIEGSDATNIYGNIVRDTARRLRCARGVITLSDPRWRAASAAGGWLQKDLVAWQLLIMARWLGWEALAGTGVAALALALLHARRQQPPQLGDVSPAPASAAAPVYGVDTGTEVEGEAPRRLRKAETVLRRRTSRMIVVLESSYDQHNQAAVLRTCDCLGIQHVWVVDPVEEKGHHEKQQRKRSSKQYATKKAREKAEKRAADEAAMRQQLAEQSGEPLGEPSGGGSGEPATAEAAAAGWRRAELNAAEADLGDGRAKMSRRISKQSAEWLSLRHFPDTPSCIAALREEGYEIWVTHLSQAATCLDDPHLIPAEGSDCKGLAVVFGREADVKSTPVQPLPTQQQ